MDSICHGENSSLATHSSDKLSLFDNAHQEAEPLGSVTYNQEIDGSSTSLQIRSSARVSKKMRLDSITTPVTAVLPDKKDVSKDEEKVEKIEKFEKYDKQDTKQNESKPKRRAWELWSQEDKNTFFEALNEYGKDFDSIQNHFATKAKRKGLGDHLIKKKDQVRHFYYRTWHKISKHLKFSDDLKNAARELYGLVNYGEIRKRVGFCTEKIMCMKLNELVYKGTIQLRVKGKTLRIKTPICRALRKLNRVQEYQEDIKLPARVMLELYPRHNEAWSRVQAVSQNPRIRTLLPLQRRLTSLLAYLNHRWRPLHLKHRDKLLSTIGSTDVTFPESEDKKKDKEPLLRVAPRAGAPICLPAFNLTEYLTSSSICLISYEERFQTWQAEGSLGKGGGKGCTSRKGTKRQRMDGNSDKKPPIDASSLVKQKENVCSEIEFVNCSLLLDDACDNNAVFSSSELYQDIGGDHMISGDEADVNDMAVNHILSLQQHTDEGGRDNDLSPVHHEDDLAVQKEEMENKNEIILPSLPQQKVDNKETIDSIRAGWTIEDANAISIGELYLMFGTDSKLPMEYWWETSPSSPTNSEIKNSIEGNAGSELTFNSVGDTLQKLISIAKLNFRKSKITCPCGHICGTTTKSSTTNRRPPPARNVVDETPGGNLSSSQQVRPAVNVSVTAMHDGVFRRPLLAPSQFKPLPKPGTAEAFKAQLDKFRPRYCNRRGRAVRPKNVVVQRMLPLLPKAPNGHAMVTLQVIPQTSQLSGEFMPIGSTVATAPQHSQHAPLLPRPTKNQHILPAAPNKSNSGSGCLLVSSASNNSGLPDIDVSIETAVSGSSVQKSEPASNVQIARKNIAVDLPQSGVDMNLHHSSATDSTNVSVDLRNITSDSDNHPRITIESSSPPLNTPVASPPSISNLLELSLPSAVTVDLALGTPTDSELLDVPIQDHSTTQPSFEGLLQNEGTLQNCATPPSSPTREVEVQWLNSEVSPSRLLKEADTQWLNSEVADFSFSSFLGHLESPMKAATSATNAEDTRLSSDVEAQLQCLMSENSVDYMAKFADLAAQIASSDASNKK